MKNRLSYGEAIMPTCEGMKIPKEMVERYGFGIFTNYPKDEFIEEYIKEFGEHPIELERERLKSARERGVLC